ncbi:adenosine deaminase/editase [Agrocybe pediades]|nr:adenosine deaminase/editase [Agrocybe pediades]
MLLNSDHDHDVDLSAAILAIHKQYNSFSYKPQHSQWTILASFFLYHATISDDDNTLKVISLATGTKCLPASKLSPRGESVHDSHAEVLARRGALRWFLEEIIRVRTSDGSYSSRWIVEGQDGKYKMKEDVHLHLYVSTLPCGDASMRFLASIQDEEMAALKSTSTFPVLDPSAASRGRDDYSRLGVLRTKPGRADSPPTLCMSCSDKIARWNVLGIQGALGAQFLSPIYIDAVIIGEVPVDMQDVVREDCERAFWARLGEIEGLPEGYSIHRPQVHFTDIPFVHSRSALKSSSSCNESICWTSQSSSSFEVLINGLKRGVSPKHRYREQSRPRLCRLALMKLCTEVSGMGNTHQAEAYSQLKLSSKEYQDAKEKLLGKGRPFGGWIKTGMQWQAFNVDGEVLQMT